MRGYNTKIPGLDPSPPFGHVAGVNTRLGSRPDRFRQAGSQGYAGAEVGAAGSALAFWISQ